MDVEFSKECPAIYDRLKNAFDVNWNDGIIIAYHPKIHCLKDVPPEKIVHEVIHLTEQEKMGVDLWYDMYISDPSFRLDEEVKAYKAEMDFLIRHVKDRELLFQLKREIAHNLSSSIYGNIITADEALRLL